MGTARGEKAVRVGMARIVLNGQEKLRHRFVEVTELPRGTSYLSALWKAERRWTLPN